MISYYNQHAETFFEETVGADMTPLYKVFLEQLPVGTSILDAGAGSCRDSLYFKQRGYKVTAMDASPKMCQLGSRYLGQEVLCLAFEEMAFEEAYDGIWACASLLHVESHALPDIIEKLTKALKSRGILFASFKYGTFEGWRNDRRFCDLNESLAKQFFETENLRIDKLFKTQDVRPDKKEEYWLNIIASKKQML